MEEGTQIMPWVGYVIAGGSVLIAGSLLTIIGYIIGSSSKESTEVADAVAKVEEKRGELRDKYGSDIGDLLSEAEKLHAASHAYPYVMHNHQILDQENANYIRLVVIARQLGIPETETRVIKAKQLHDSANGKNYVRSPQLLEQADANYELSLAILEHLQR